MAVGGGKGGTGKSVVACNLAVTIAQAGYRTVLVDADLGGANLHTLFGIERPPVLLEHFIERRVERLDETMLPTMLKNLHLVCGGMPVLGTANPKHTQKQRLIRHILGLEADVILIDVGAGVSYNVLDLFNAAAVKIAVITPQLTSIHNGYGFLKVAIHRNLSRAIAPEARKYLESSGPEAGDERISQMLERLADYSEVEARKAWRLLESYRADLVGNMLDENRELHVIDAVARMARDHLQIDATVIGVLKRGDKINRSINDRSPFMVRAGIESNAEAFRGMANKLLARAARWKRDSRAAPGSREEAYERSAPRYPLDLPACLRLGGDRFEGRVRNIAMGGVCVKFEREPPGPVAGDLVLGSDRSGKDLVVRVEERNRDAAGSSLGFTFVSVSKTALKGIERLVAEATADTAVLKRKGEACEQTIGQASVSMR